MNETNKFNQRFNQIRGMRHQLQHSNITNLPTLIGQLNISLDQYDKMLDGEIDNLQIQQIQKKHGMSVDVTTHKKALIKESIADPYIVIDQTKKARFQAQKGSQDQDYLTQVLDQIIIIQKVNKPKRPKSLGFQKVKKGLINQPKYIMSRCQRMDPFARPAILRQENLNNLGILSLLNKGIIPKDIDIGPAFENGQPLLQNKAAEIHEFSSRKIKQYDQKYSLGLLRRQSKTFQSQTNESKDVKFTSNPSDKQTFAHNYSQISIEEVSQKQLAQIFLIHQITFRNCIYIYDISQG